MLSFKDAYGALFATIEMSWKKSWSLTGASFSTIWRSEDVHQTQENIALCLDDICKLRILIQRLTVVTSASIVSSLISHGCWKENIRQVNKHGNQLQYSVVNLVSPKEKSGLLFSQKACLFLKRPQEAWVIHRWFGVVADRACWGSIKEWTREMCDFVMLGKIDGENLRAEKARFHDSCRKSYLRCDDCQKLAASDGTDEAYGKEQNAA